MFLNRLAGTLRARYLLLRFPKAQVNTLRMWHILCSSLPLAFPVCVVQIGEAPYFGQFGHFAVYAPVKLDYAVNR